MSNESALAPVEGGGIALPRSGDGVPKVNLPSCLYLSSQAKGETLKKAIAAGIDAGEFGLFDSQGARKIKPFRIVPSKFFIHLYVLQDESNRVVGASWKKQDHPYSEQIVSLVLVVEPDDSMVTPALLSTNRALNRLHDNIADALVLAGMPTDANPKGNGGKPWFLRSPAHAATAATDNPFFRVVAEIWGTKEKAKTPGGRDFNLGRSKTAPAPAKLIETLKAFDLSGDSFAAVEAFKRKAGWLSKLANGEAPVEEKEEEGEGEEAGGDIPF